MSKNEADKPPLVFLTPDEFFTNQPWSKSTGYIAIKKGQIPSIKIGSRYYILPNAAEIMAQHALERMHNASAKIIGDGERPCLYCGKLFKGKTQRAMFCTDSHKQMHYQKRRKERETTKQKLGPVSP